MQSIDWLILISVLFFIVFYGIWKTRKIKSGEGFLTGGKQSPWWLVGLSVMATQASAITFLSTPGVAYQSGMRFLQFYLAMPLAIVILCVFFIPRFFKLNVTTAYEYLESRFGLPTRLLTAVLFLVQRGLAAGLTIFAPAIVLSTILGWNLKLTVLAIGVLVTLYTLLGGTQAVNQTQKQQMLVIFIGMFVAFLTILNQLPLNLGEALHLSGQLNKLEAVDFKFDLKERYNIWSAFLGGTFLFMSYFGTDQSQVQRYLSGKDAKQAKLGLLFNGLFKVPMQFFILLTGVMVFVFFQYNEAPVHFNPEVREMYADNETYLEFEKRSHTLFEEKKKLIDDWTDLQKQGQRKGKLVNLEENQEAQAELKEELTAFLDADKKKNKYKFETNDKDYVFIHYILNYFPKGLVGLLLAVILSAAMSSTASEINALATTTVVDIYKRNFDPHLAGKQYLNISRVFTAIWGFIALFFALNASLFDSLVEAVNIIGSLFYGVILGVFAIAFLLPMVKGRAVMVAICLVQPMIIVLYYLDHFGQIDLPFLWLNPIGCLSLMFVALVIEVASPKENQLY